MRSLGEMDHALDKYRHMFCCIWSWELQITATCPCLAPDRGAWLRVFTGQVSVPDTDLLLPEHGLFLTMNPDFTCPDFDVFYSVHIRVVCYYIWDSFTSCNLRKRIRNDSGETRKYGSLTFYFQPFITKPWSILEWDLIGHSGAAGRCCCCTF